MRRAAVLGLVALVAPWTAADAAPVQDGPMRQADNETLTAAVRQRRTVYELPSYPVSFCDFVNGGMALEAGQQPNAVDVIGWSVLGRPLWAEHWGPIDAPQILAIAQVHGDECTPTVLSRVARHFPWSNVGVWLIPALNPDGYAAFTRENANNADLNGDGYHLSQPESQALMELTQRVQPVLSVYVHSPNDEIGFYPEGPEPFDSLAKRIAAALADVAGTRFSGAGTRVGTNWFLWQGQQRAWPGGESVLIELPPMTDWESPSAFRRGPIVSLPEAEDLCLRLLAVLDAALG